MRVHAALVRARELPAQIPAVVADALDLTPDEQKKQQELARIGWTEAGWHALVSGAWLGASLGLGALANAMVHYGNAAAVLIMSGSFAGLLGPLAISGVRRVNAAFSARRLALETADDDELGHLSAPLRTLVGDTRVAIAGVEGQGIAGDGRRSVWEWLRSLENLEERDRWELQRRGLTPDAVRKILLEEDMIFGGLTRGQRRRISRLLRRVLDELSRSGFDPYR